MLSPPILSYLASNGAMGRKRKDAARKPVPRNEDGIRSMSRNYDPPRLFPNLPPHDPPTTQPLDVAHNADGYFGILTMNAYQRMAKQTQAYPEKVAIIYCLLEIANEAGELAGKYKKWLRGDEQMPYTTRHTFIDGSESITELPPPERRVPQNLRAAMADEMGDILWPLAQLAGHLGYSFNDIAAHNLMKLHSRSERGTIKGDGDAR